MNAQYLPSTFEERMAHVTEEAGEVVLMIGKIGRFGLLSRHPNGGPTNVALLLSELTDLKGAIERLEPDLLEALGTERFP